MTVNDPNRGAPPPAADPGDSPTVAWTPPGQNPVESYDERTHAEPVRQAARASRLRWGIALLVTVLVVAVGAAAVILLTNRGSVGSTTAGYAGTDSVAYGELRLDFPGDQKQKLGTFLSKFPGFADQSTLDVKIDDVLDRIIKELSANRQDWSTKIKPWFSGELGFAVGSLPRPEAPGVAPSEGPDGLGGMSQPRGLLILSVSDEARARAWFDEVTADATRTTTSYGGTDVTVVGEGAKSGAMAIHGGRTMLVGDEASVRAAIDTKGEGGLAETGALRDALGTAPGDSLGFVFINLEDYAQWIEDIAVAIPGASTAPATDLYKDLLPAWMLLRFRAEGDALAFDSVVPHMATISGATKNSASVLAGHVPASTFLFAEGHEVGASMLQIIEILKRDPATARSFEAVEQQVALIGGLDGLIGWWADAAIVLARDGSDGVHGGLVIQPKDRADAEQLLGVIRAGVQLGAAGGITTREEDHNGTTITVFDVGDASLLGQLFGMAGVPAGPTLPEGRIEIAVATTDQVVVLSSSSSFVKAVLDAGSTDTLAENARFGSLAGKVGAENLGITFVDIAAVREMIETAAASDADAMAHYTSDIKPYLLPLDAFVTGIRLDGSVDRSLTLVTVK